MSDIKQAVELARGVLRHHGMSKQPRTGSQLSGWKHDALSLARALLLAHATIEKQARIVDASKALRACELDAPLGSSIAEMTKAATIAADRTYRALTVWRSAIDAMGDAEGGECEQGA